MGSRGGDRRRRWVAEDEIGGGGEKIGGAECLGGVGWVVEEEIGGEDGRMRWVVGKIGGGGGGEKIGGGKGWVVEGEIGGEDGGDG